MKANYTRDNEGIRKSKMVMSKADIQEALQEEWESKKDLVYTEVKKDVSAQILAVFFSVLNKDFGFGKTRLMRVKESVESYFHIMQDGVFFRDFTPIDCIEYIKKEFGIDLDKEEIIK